MCSTFSAPPDRILSPLMEHIYTLLLIWPNIFSKPPQRSGLSGSQCVHTETLLHLLLTLIAVMHFNARLKEGGHRIRRAIEESGLREISGRTHRHTHRLSAWCLSSWWSIQRADRQTWGMGAAILSEEERETGDSAAVCHPNRIKQPVRQSWKITSVFTDSNTTSTAECRRAPERHLLVLS